MIFPSSLWKSGCTNRFVRLLRAEQYVKNTFVLLPLFFAGRVQDGHLLVQALVMFMVFCCASSATYIFNDCQDRHEDRHHPTKRLRPIANGEVSVSSALFLAAGLLGTSCLLAGVMIGTPGLLIVVSYLALNVIYSLKAKHISIIDVTCIALGFVLRVGGGTVATGLAFSQWLFLLVFLLCMFLGLGKRWDDLKLIEAGQVTGKVRKSLSGYSDQFVTSAMTFFATISCICYIVYTTLPETQAHYHSEYVYITALWVVLGIMRYQQIIFLECRSGSPTRVLLRDRFVRMTVIAWVVHIYFLLYC